MDMQVTELDNGITEVILAGRLDMEGSGKIKNAFTIATATDAAPVLVDLSQVDFIASIGMRLLVMNAKALSRRGIADVPAGAVFLREGEPGDTFFFVRSGEVDIIKALGTDHERHLAARTTGSVIGEMSLLNPDQPRSASARARTPVELLVMTRVEFETLIARYPAVSLDLLRRLSRCLRMADEIIYMALVCTLVRAEARRTATPKEVLRAVNRELDAREIDGMFVTMLYGELDLTTGDFIYVRAGHDHPLIRTHKGDLVQGEPARSVALGLLPVPLLHSSGCG